MHRARWMIAAPALAVAVTLLGSCAVQAEGWRPLWTDSWQWHHDGWRWLRGVTDGVFDVRVEAHGARLRCQLLSLGQKPASVVVEGPRQSHEWLVNPGEQLSAELQLEPGAHSVRVPASVVVGSPRLGRPLRAPRMLVFVLVDTLRSDHVSRETTPAVLDALDGGRRWHRATANCSWTLPSMASMFTARPVLELSSPEGDLIGIPHGIDGWPTQLEEAGFTGAAVVANYTVHVLNGFAGGFSEYVVPDGAGTADHPDATWVVAEARRWLAEHHGEDSFLYLHFMDPHQPYRSHSDPTVQAPDLEPLAMRRRAASAEERALLLRLYGEEVAHLDQVLGPFLAELPDRAVVVFTSDHGEALGEHGAWGHGLNLYQESLDVPLIIRAPMLPAGDAAGPVELLDIAPTVLELMGVAPAAGMVGRSLLSDGPRRPIVSTTFGGGPLRWAWRRGDSKVVIRTAAQPGLGAESRSAMREERPLPAGGFQFDLASDPAEASPIEVADELLPEVAGAFAESAGRMVPGLQLLAVGRRGRVTAEVAVAGSAEPVQAWGVGPIDVRRRGDRIAVACDQGFPVCGVAMRVDPVPDRLVAVGDPSTWRGVVVGEPIVPDRLVPPVGALDPGLRLWWNPDRSLVVGGIEETVERLRALGYVE